MCWPRNLSHAYCDSTNITNRGLLELVNRCSKLQEISVVNWKISDRMIEQLLAARPMFISASSKRSATASQSWKQLSSTLIFC